MHRHARQRAFVSHDPRQARARLVTALVVGLATAAALPARLGRELRAVAGWDAAALCMAALCWWLIARGDAEETRCRAAADDPGRRAVWLIVILASGFSLFAAAIMLRVARAQPDTRPLFVALGVVAVASAWLLTHTAYTLRYAHLYYRDDGDGEGGLVFPGAQPPDFLDFAYFAFTIGMCFQVSDVAIVARGIRRTVIGHSLLSFAYNTAILATVVNLVVGAFN